MALFSYPATAGRIDCSSALYGVAAGETQWIEQTQALTAIAEVKQTQQLEDTMVLAMPTNSAVTLKASQTIDAGKWPHMIGSDIICTPPTEKSAAEIAAFYKRMCKVLLETIDGAHRLWILEASREEFKQIKHVRLSKITNPVISCSGSPIFLFIFFN
ncbi:MAG: hypothetical protein E7A35_18060 [Leclercia adecarboxylata]|nr:hypothetical protein [Leclercia adecarboxylata]